MKVKLFKFLGVGLFMFFLSLLVFSMSSKTDPTSNPQVPCKEKITNANLKSFIQINFQADADLKPFRKIGYEGYIPTPDLRFGNLPPSPTLGSNEYTITVYLSSPECSQWSWSGMASSDNITSGGKMEIPMVPPGYEITVKVVYKEKGEAVGGLNFNRETSQITGASALMWQYEQTFMSGWERKIPQPIYLTPTNLIPITDLSSSKKKEIVDYRDVNHYLDVHQLLGH